MRETFEGRCSCGALAYRMTSRPIITHCCHCSYCQRETGSAFAINAMIEADRIEVLSGKSVEQTIPSLSEKGLIMVRCAQCQTTVWTHYMQDRFASWVRVGTLDTPQEISPDVHIYTGTKQPWVTIPKNIPSFEVFYDWDHNTFWPKASKERDRVLLEQTISTEN